jgi:hypothetical protein
VSTPATLQGPAPVGQIGFLSIKRQSKQIIIDLNSFLLVFVVCLESAGRWPTCTASARLQIVLPRAAAPDGGVTGACRSQAEDGEWVGCAHYLAGEVVAVRFLMSHSVVKRPLQIRRWRSIRVSLYEGADASACFSQPLCSFDAPVCVACWCAGAEVLLDVASLHQRPKCGPRCSICDVIIRSREPDGPHGNGRAHVTCISRRNRATTPRRTPTPRSKRPYDTLRPTESGSAWRNYAPPWLRQSRGLDAHWRPSRHHLLPLPLI